MIPSDAARLVGSGRLDRRLFDVTTLLDFGYDDAARADVPLIVQAGRGRSESLLAAATSAGASAPVDLPAADATALRVPKGPAFWAALTRDQGRSLAAPDTAIWLDGKRRTMLDRSVPQINAPQAWAQGLTGAGVTVAVLDTGIDATHPDFAGAIAASRNFIEGEADDDLVGHGTHVASTVTGSGAASGGRYRGAAPDASLLDGKVCGNFGCPESAILAGMQWAAESGADVVNMSLGGPDFPGFDPVEQAVEDLTVEFGTLFVVAAGNSGAPETVGSPGSAPQALTVGAVDRNDQIADFSSRGPGKHDGALKPDLTAPGVNIVAANAANGFLGAPGEPYTTLSGTSMATPHAAGAAAILVQQHPEWTPAQVKAALMVSAEPNADASVLDQGAGRIDVAAATSLPIEVVPASVSLPLQMWPHDDDEPASDSVTFGNPSSAPVRLALSMTTEGPGGITAPDGMFRLDRSDVVVPAGGSATVGVTVDTSTPSPDGYYTARVRAVGGDVDVTVPFGVEKEVESYDVTVALTDNTGAPSDDHVLFVTGVDSELFDVLYDADGTITTRVPKGRYMIDGIVQTVIPGQPLGDLAIFVQPELVVSGDTSVTLDARRAEPVTMSFAQPGRTPILATLSWETRGGANDAPGGFITSTFDGISTAMVGSPIPADRFNAYAMLTAKATTAPGAGRSPAHYHAAAFETGRMFTGLRRVIRDRDLARVQTDYRSGARAEEMALLWFPALPGRSTGSTGGFPVVVPGLRDDYLSTGGTEWSGFVFHRVSGPNGIPFDITPFEVDRFAPVAGGQYPLQLGGAVVGPTLQRFGVLEPSGPRVWAERSGNTMNVAVRLIGDAGGNLGLTFGGTPERTALYRDGRLVGETDVAGTGTFEVPGRDSAYRLESSVDRSSVAGLSTVVSTVWSFRSARSGDTSALPLSVVRFAPRLAADNTAVAGSRLRVPVSVQLNPGVRGVSERLLTVEVSFDDGANWVQAPVRSTSNGARVVVIDHPAAAGFVSLRATATDTAGNRVEQTILRAYATR